MTQERLTCFFMCTKSTDLLDLKRLLNEFVQCLCFVGRAERAHLVVSSALSIYDAPYVVLVRMR